MMCRLLLSCFMMLFAITPVRAQADAGASRSGVSRVAKWVLAGATVALGAYAYRENRSAQRVYDRMRTRCEANPSTCVVDDGRYLDAESESMHARMSAHDRRARTGIVAAQFTLLGSVAFFIYDLRGARGPENIPYPAYRARIAAGSVQLGARLPFRP